MGSLSNKLKGPISGFSAQLRNPLSNPLVSNSFFITFGTVRNAAPSTVETPNIVWSRRAYFSPQEAGALFTLPPGWKCTFNGTTILTASGEIPAGAKRWKVGAPASTAYSTTVTGTPVLGGVDYPFVITTIADLSFGPTWEDSQNWDDSKTWNE